MKELFVTGTEKNNEDCFPLNLLNVKIEQQKGLININSKLSAQISDRGSGYSKKDLNKFKIICYDIIVYIP